MLLACGGRWLDVDAAKHSDENTPLHITCLQSNNQKILKLLLQSGCHKDCVNKYGMTPLDYLRDPEWRSFFSYEQSSLKLKCLCARFIVKERSNINWLNALTPTLSKFVVLHGYHSIKPVSPIEFSLVE